MVKHEQNFGVDSGKDLESTTTFSIHGARYVALNLPKPLSIAHQGPPSYAMVFGAGEETYIDETWLERALEFCRSHDDVFRDEFLNGVIFTKVTGDAGLEISTTAHRLLVALGSTWVTTLCADDDEEIPPPGPYIVRRQQLLRVFRLYDDVQGAFMNGLIQAHDSAFKELRLGGKYVQTLSLAVPSRLPCAASIIQPLAGLRVAVKDIFRIKGIRTSVCNRAYYELYPPAMETATCIDILCQLGATVVGATKLASFAATEEPIECVDFQAPWNPRADGYQSPAGSSSGSGAAIASYPWLDIAIGSDTSGSGRRPAHWNGCFAMRPSHGILPVDGYIPSFREFDVPCFYGRDINECQAFVRHWYGSLLPDVTSLTPSIIYPLDYMATITNDDQLRIVDAFVKDLEISLGVQSQEISFETLWNETPPTEAGGQSLSEYMKNACKDSFFHDDYHNLDRFREDYRSQFSKEPYVSPPVRWQWEISAKISEADRDTAVARLEVYRKWFSEVVMKVETNNSFVIIPIENISPRYRDEATSRFCPVGVPMLFLSPITRGPELTIPVGEVPFESKVSGRCEHLPVAVSLLASPGQDLKLFDLARTCLKESGRPTQVLAGNKLFAA